MNLFLFKKFLYKDFSFIKYNSYKNNSYWKKKKTWKRLFSNNNQKDLKYFFFLIKIRN